MPEFADFFPCLILSVRVSTIPMGRQIDEKGEEGLRCYRENRKKSYSLYTIGESDLGARAEGTHTHIYKQEKRKRQDFQKTRKNELLREAGSR